MGTLRFTTAGESHGPGLTAVVEGLPAGLELRPEDAPVTDGLSGEPAVNGDGARAASDAAASRAA